MLEINYNNSTVGMIKITLFNEIDLYTINLDVEPSPGESPVITQE